ncbi:MAG: hypothetical protein IKE55_08255 [Kiritimatiellae bacterium]|nr:hypothetical protein [Kiritimatiellia bacterium]
MPIVLSAVLILAVAMLPAYGDRFLLVKDGVAAPVVIPADAEASTELAAAELADYVQKITGKRPELLTNDYARVLGVWGCILLFEFHEQRCVRSRATT